MIWLPPPCVTICSGGKTSPDRLLPRLPRLTSCPSGNRFGSVPPNCEKASPKKNGANSRSTERSNLTITSTDHPSGRLHEEGVCRRPIFRRTYYPGKKVSHPCTY